MVLQLRRWLPQRSLVLVGDNGYAVLDLLHCCQSLSEPVTLIARLRLDAALYAPAPPRQPGQNGRPALKGARRPSLKALLEQPPATDQPQVTWTSATVGWYDGATRTVELTSQTAVWYRSGKPPVRIRWVLIRDPQGAFAPQALLCTDPSADPTQILEWFVLRWQLEVTFQEVRTHLGVETQRQWSDLAITRTTPVLLGLFSWITLAAHALQERHPMIQRRAAWYDKPSPTFVDAIALVRRHLWLASEGFPGRPATPIRKNSPPLCTTDWWIPSLTPPEMRKVQGASQVYRAVFKLELLQQPLDCLVDGLAFDGRTELVAVPDVNIVREYQPVGGRPFQDGSHLLPPSRSFGNPAAGDVQVGVQRRAGQGELPGQLRPFIGGSGSRLVLRLR